MTTEERPGRGWPRGWWQEAKAWRQAARLRATMARAWRAGEAAGWRFWKGLEAAEAAGLEATEAAEAAERAVAAWKEACENWPANALWTVEPGSYARGLMQMAQQWRWYAPAMAEGHKAVIDALEKMGAEASEAKWRRTGRG